MLVKKGDLRMGDEIYNGSKRQHVVSNEDGIEDGAIVVLLVRTCRVFLLYRGKSQESMGTCCVGSLLQCSECQLVRRDGDLRLLLMAHLTVYRFQYGYSIAK